MWLREEVYQAMQLCKGPEARRKGNSLGGEVEPGKRHLPGPSAVKAFFPENYQGGVRSVVSKKSFRAQASEKTGLPPSPEAPSREVKGPRAAV